MVCYLRGEVPPPFSLLMLELTSECCSTCMSYQHSNSIIILYILMQLLSIEVGAVQGLGLTVLGR